MAFTLGIDIGGTFTDTVVMDDAGDVRTYKSPTTPADLVQGLVENVRLAAELEQLETAAFLEHVDRIAHGTTAATNAFLERRGAKVALLATRGFEDVIFQQRMMGMTAGLTPSELTDYSRRAVPEPLAEPELVLGVRERVDYRGESIGPLREEDVHAAADRFAAAGVEAVAVCFLWSFKNPAHEERAGEILRERLPEAYLSLSSRLAPRLGEYERTATTLVNAYLGPVIARYTRTLEERLGEHGSRAQVLLLDSGGSVMTPREATRQPVSLLLSGPSGGMTASQRLGERLGHRDVITFDMGGTSTDVGMIVDGVPLRRNDAVFEKYHLLVPMADIRAIGAGGGSIARVDGRYLRVGPESAGARPGPVAYGRGGTLPTVTDADLALGILDPERFLGGRLALDTDAAARAIEEHVARPLGLDVLEAAAAIKQIVDSRMADLLRTVTIERGHDPRAFALYAFGGAGPTHAPAFALDLVDEIVVPATQSVHSALGAIASDLACTHALSEPMRLARSGDSGDPARIDEVFETLERQARTRLADQGAAPEDVRLQRFVEMRFARQTKELRVPYPPTRPDSLEPLVDAFLRTYARRYGEESVPESAGLELVTFAVEASAALPRPQLRTFDESGPDASPARVGARKAWDAAARAMAPTDVFEGERLRPGNRVAGPAVIEYDTTTVALTSGQIAVVDSLLNLSIRRDA
jgi:N-methylhydantoinase A